MTGQCTCGEVAGEDPGCVLHGRASAWEFAPLIMSAYRRDSVYYADDEGMDEFEATVLTSLLEQFRQAVVVECAKEAAHHRETAELAAYERAAKACEDQRDIFASEEYAVGQPLSSFQERFACKQCAAAIRSLSAEGE